MHLKQKQKVADALVSDCDAARREANCVAGHEIRRYRAAAKRADRAALDASYQRLVACAESARTLHNKWVDASIAELHAAHALALHQMD